jgi:hypothetical protein
VAKTESKGGEKKMYEIFNILTLIVIAVLIAGLVANAKGTAQIINATSGFFSRAFAAELGHAPTAPKGF